MRFIIFFFIITIAFSCNSSKQANSAVCCKSRLTKKDLTVYSFHKLGKEYQRLKEKKMKCCDNFGSDFHKIMQALSEKFDSTSADTSYIIKIMGTPDAREVPKQYGNFNKPEEKIFVYWWRSWHDFLYFISENGKVKYAKFFYAYE
jgi:hypothetical protein